MGQAGRGDALESHEARLRRLEEAVSKLKPVQREVLLLCRQEDLTYHQIGERMEISRDAVERHLANALYELDRHMERAERPWWRFW